LQESGTGTTNLYFHVENSPRAQFQAHWQAMRAEENNASMRQVTILILSLSQQFDRNARN